MSVPLAGTAYLVLLDQPPMRRNEYLFDLADWLTNPPSGGPIQMWVVGAGLSSLVSLYGTSCILTQRATSLNITMRGLPADRTGALAGDLWRTCGLVWLGHRLH